MSETTRPGETPVDDEPTVLSAAGDLRDRLAAERDDMADRADRIAATGDRRAEELESLAGSADSSFWRSQLNLVREAAAEARRRAAADRAAARADREAAAADRRRSAFDNLTGAYRRDAGMAELALDLDRAHRTGQSIVIGFLDVDGLKAVNDKHGHTAGDDVLRCVASTVRSHLRPSDVLVRWGGDEFVFSALGLDVPEVRERLDAVETALRTAGTGSITCGIALAADAASIHDVIALADTDLYRRRGAARPAPSDSRLEAARGARTLEAPLPPRIRGRGSLHVADQYDLPSIDSTALAASIDSVLAAPHKVRPVFQPIVDLGDGAVVGYEALARWPEYPNLNPSTVMTAAAQRDVLSDVDWACRAAALEGAMDASALRSRTLFLNIEPNASGKAPVSVLPVVRAAAQQLDIVLELTERSLLSDPAALLAGVDRARADGCRIALDDVGSNPDTLALLEFYAPDIIKLDRVLVQQDPTAQQAEILAAISAHVEATGAVILAEGIETEDHLDRARAYGATLGQGWMFGRPAPLPDTTDLGRGSRRAGVRHSTSESLGTVTGRVPSVPTGVFDYALPSIGRKALLFSMTRQIEERALEATEPLTILSSFQDARRFTPAIADRYARLAAENPFVAVLGTGMAEIPAPGVRGTNLVPDEPLTQQWTITVVGQHYFAAVIARDLGDTGSDNDRRFEFLHTHDRDVVVAAARSLMRRVVPAGHC